MRNDTVAYIIAGGKSSRFGSDKIFHIINGRPMISSVIESISPSFKKIYIVSNSSEKFLDLGIEVIPDKIKDIGPIGGIYTALSSCTSRRCFVFAADMPNISHGLVDYMLKIESDDDAIVPNHAGFYEPLHSIYSVSCLKKMDDFIKSGERSLVNLLENISIRIVDEKEISIFGNPEILFKNINRPDDLADNIN